MYADLITKRVVVGGWWDGRAATNNRPPRLVETSRGGHCAGCSAHREGGHPSAQHGLLDLALRPPSGYDAPDAPYLFGFALAFGYMSPRQLFMDEIHLDSPVG
jgi:hypothetical protein